MPGSSHNAQTTYYTLHTLHSHSEMKRHSFREAFALSLCRSVGVFLFFFSFCILPLFLCHLPHFWQRLEFNAENAHTQPRPRIPNMANRALFIFMVRVATAIRTDHTEPSYKNYNKKRPLNGHLPLDFLYSFYLGDTHRLRHTHNVPVSIRVSHIRIIANFDGQFMEINFIQIKRYSLVSDINRMFGYSNFRKKNKSKTIPRLFDSIFRFKQLIGSARKSDSRENHPVPVRFTIGK